MIILPELPVYESPRAYIGPEETTTLNNVLKKVALFGILLGSGLLLASFFTGIPLLIVGAAVTAISAYALYFLSKIDSSKMLIDAAASGNRCMVKFLLLLGANPNIDPRRMALAKAAWEGRTGIVKDLLNAGANPNSMDFDHRTPLFDAVQGFNDGAVEVLLEFGADPTVQTVDFDGNDAIEAALRIQQIFQGGGDRIRLYDYRTLEERKAAANRIADMLRPYREAE